MMTMRYKIIFLCTTDNLLVMILILYGKSIDHRLVSKYGIIVPINVLLNTLSLFIKNVTLGSFFCFKFIKNGDDWLERRCRNIVVRFRL